MSLKPQKYSFAVNITKYLKTCYCNSPSCGHNLTEYTVDSFTVNTFVRQAVPVINSSVTKTIPSYFKSISHLSAMFDSWCLV